MRMRVKRNKSAQVFKTVTGYNSAVCYPCEYKIRIPPSPQNTLEPIGLQGLRFEKCAISAQVVNGLDCLAASKTKHMQQLKTALIYNANGDTNKRWYVYYYVLEGEKRVKYRLYGGINYRKHKDQRQQLIENMRQEVQRKLDLGITNINELVHPEHYSSKTIGEYISLVVNEKQLSQTKASGKTTMKHMRGFLRWLELNNLHNLPPQTVQSSTILSFRKYLLQQEKSNRTVNNYLIDINAFFNYLLKRIDDYNHKNPCLGITKLPTRSETHVTYTPAQAKAISSYLKDKNPFLYLFCKFITYSFMRPSEIAQLKLNQIDTENWTITRTAAAEKTGKRKVQIIQEIFRPTIIELKLHEYNPNLYLFGTRLRPGAKHMSYEYFRKHFKKVKDQLGLSSKHTMYGLKHTFICQLKRNGAQDEELMPITGHETKEALHKYLRDIGAAPIKDLSSYYSFEF